MENQTNTSGNIVSVLVELVANCFIEIHSFFSFRFVCSDGFLAKCHYLKICFRSLTYNHHMSQDYASDVALEPIIWIVDNFSGFLGPVNKHTIEKL